MAPLAPSCYSTLTFSTLEATASTLLGVIGRFRPGFCAILCDMQVMLETCSPPFSSCCNPLENLSNETVRSDPFPGYRCRSQRLKLECDGIGTDHLGVHSNLTHKLMLIMVYRYRSGELSCLSKSRFDIMNS